jgi:hypothetical protein
MSLRRASAGGPARRKRRARRARALARVFRIGRGTIVLEFL